MRHSVVVKEFPALIASLVFCLLLSTTLAADDFTFAQSYPQQMMRFTSTNTPAHKAARLFMRGVNLGNYFESPTNGIWSNTIPAEDFQIMKREGFDHVRIPTRWGDYAVILELGYGVEASGRAVPAPETRNSKPGTLPQANGSPMSPAQSGAGVQARPPLSNSGATSNPKSKVLQPAGGAQKPGGRNLQQTSATASGATPRLVSSVQSPAGGASGPASQSQMTVRSWNNTEFKIEHRIFDRTDFAVTNALNAGLAVIMGMDHADGFTSDPAGQTQNFLEVWARVARHYATFTNTLAFELLCEPKDAATAKVLNPIFAQAIAVIRKTNPTRTIFIGAGIWDQESELKNLVLPANDNNLIVSIHCYQPPYFTYQGVAWAGSDAKALKGIQFPGPPAKPFVLDASLKTHPWLVDWIYRYNTFATETNPCSPLAFAGELKFARAWSVYYGRPVHVGEFGCYTTADADSRARYYAAFRQECDKGNLGWAIWDWNEGFRYWDKSKNQPAPGMHKALFERD
jgi:aryl-phospho-beta-D-glucosidase BglC (GH1 family)